MDNVILAILHNSANGFLVNSTLAKQVNILSLAVGFNVLKAVVGHTGLHDCLDILWVGGTDVHKIDAGMFGGVGKDELDAGTFFGQYLTKLVANNTQSTAIVRR